MIQKSVLNHLRSCQVDYINDLYHEEIASMESAKGNIKKYKKELLEFFNEKKIVRQYARLRRKS